MTWLKGLTLGQRVGSMFGSIYVLIGVVGFAITSGSGFFALRGKDLVVFEVNPLHNVVHLGIGALLLYAAMNSPAASRSMNRFIGGTYLVAAVLGVFLVQADTSIFRGLSETRSGLNILALNHADNVLHLASAIVLIGSTLLGRRRSADPVDEQADTPEAIDEMPVVVRRNLRGGDQAPRSGTFRCVCGRFTVAIRQGRELPQCPEPTGTDDDHFFRLQARKVPSSKAKTPAARSKGRPKVRR